MKMRVRTDVDDLPNPYHIGTYGCYEFCGQVLEFDVLKELINDAHPDLGSNTFYRMACTPNWYFPTSWLEPVGYENVEPHV